MAEAEQRLSNNEDLVHMAGGSKPERMIGGRYPDLLYKNTRTGKLVAIQVGRTTKSGLPVVREVKAIADLRRTGQFEHVFFIKY